jgi:hypothetical protein
VANCQTVEEVRNLHPPPAAGNDFFTHSRVRNIFKAAVQSD